MHAPCLESIQNRLAGVATRCVIIRFVVGGDDLRSDDKADGADGARSDAAVRSGEGRGRGAAGWGGLE